MGSEWRYITALSYGAWYMYVVECADTTLYTGITKCIDRRLREHNGSNRGAKYTRSRRPVKLVYYKQYQDQSSALKAESKFKKMTRFQKLQIVKGFYKNGKD